MSDVKVNTSYYRESDHLYKITRISKKGRELVIRITTFGPRFIRTLRYLGYPYDLGKDFNGIFAGGWTHGAKRYKLEIVVGKFYLQEAERSKDRQWGTQVVERKYASSVYGGRPVGKIQNKKIITETSIIKFK